MAVRVTFYADQGSSAIITATLTLRGLPLVPTSLRWTLTDDRGNTINARRDVAITPASTATIVLTGGDLMAIEPIDNYMRILTLEGTYDSIDGTGLTLAGEYKFGLKRLVGAD
jgi:hypothetical protein